MLLQYMQVPLSEEEYRSTDQSIAEKITSMWRESIWDHQQAS